MREFMIGDRVAAAHDAPEGKSAIRTNDCGTVCYFDGSGMVDVRWDKHVGGHSCMGHCERGYGWKVWPKDLILIEEEEEEEEADFDIDEDAFLSMI